MNTEKLNEYLELCDKIIEAEKKDITHKFDWEYMDDDLAVVDSHVIVDTLKYHGILCEDFTEGPPAEWMASVWGDDWEETYSQFRDTEEHDKLLAKFEQMIETIKDVAISHNIEAADDLKDWEETMKSLRYV
jgi:hypothetical protein